MYKATTVENFFRTRNIKIKSQSLNLALDVSLASLPFKFVCIIRKFGGKIWNLAVKIALNPVLIG